jgi:hypothetical protein
MIAQRFRPIGWVAGVAVAACALYMISLQVASERGKLEAIDRKIASTKREIRQLQTEVGTRASLRQLERWNGEVLALSAPTAGQYLSGEASLASVDRNRLGTASAPPPPVMMAVMADNADAPIVEKPLLATMTEKVPPKPLTKVDRVVQQAIAPRSTSVAAARPAAEARTKLARVEKTLLDKRTLGDISQKAGSERKKAAPKP